MMMRLRRNTRNCKLLMFKSIKKPINSTQFLGVKEMLVIYYGAWLMVFNIPTELLFPIRLRSAWMLRSLLHLKICHLLTCEKQSWMTTKLCKHLSDKLPDCDTRWIAQLKVESIDWWIAINRDSFRINTPVFPIVSFEINQASLATLHKNRFVHRLVAL